MLLLPADQNTENIINSKNIDELLTSQLQAEKCAHIYKIVLRTWWGRSEFKRWCMFLNTRDISSTLLAYCDGLSMRKYQQAPKREAAILH